MSYKRKLPTILFTAMTFSLGACAMKQETLESKLYGEWTLVAISTSSAPSSPALSTKDGRAQFSMTLMEDGSAYGMSACNRWKGSFLMNDNRLTLHGGAKTKKRCFFDNNNLKPLETNFPSLLSKSARFSFNGEWLELSVENGERWIFER